MLTKKDAKMAQGLAILGMVMLHLFCRLDNLPYETIFKIGGGTANILYWLIWGLVCNGVLLLQRIRTGSVVK